MFVLYILLAFGLSACVSENSNVIRVDPIPNYLINVSGDNQISILVDNIGDRSLKSDLFGSNERMAKKTQVILTNHLNQINLFNVVDRDYLDTATFEQNIENKDRDLQGANYIFSCSISEFGRKEISNKSLFGIISKGKSQIAYAKVTLQIIDVKNSKIIYTTQGAGEYSFNNEEVLGFGSNASYDSTLDNKVIDLAIREVVSNLVNAIASNSIKFR